ncbi:HRDC domain-containing protein [Sorangium cellulosum]|uniref:HRDC domain-containing protein n=1 Tax=Sorangium cellulosum TaxID=56 RepID=UPI0010110F68|nr:ribonuclease D [Sorangium cellulosum]
MSSAALVLVERDADLARLVERAARADAIAVDVEANGLFAYRPRLCTVQLAFREGDRVAVGIVDALRVPVAPLAPLLGAAGPPKVLHDLTFDARMLAEAGAPLAAARDTSVAARMLGRAATGLGALLLSELGVKVDKQLQQHDWARRPLARAELSYLADDVLHLLPLDARLAEQGRALGIEDEIAEECAYKLGAALGPPRDPRPAYARIKGAQALDPEGRAILRRLVDARAAAAAAADVPAFKIVANEVLLELARRKPARADDVRAVRGAAAGRAAPLIEAWLRAALQGRADGDVPEEDRALFQPVRPSRRELAARRALEGRLTAWRRAEAKARSVDEQVVLPGHCAQDLLTIALAEGHAGDAAVAAAIARIPGLGARRLARYGRALAALVAAARESEPPGPAV